MQRAVQEMLMLLKLAVTQISGGKTASLPILELRIDGHAEYVLFGGSSKCDGFEADCLRLCHSPGSHGVSHCPFNLRFAISPHEPGSLGIEPETEAALVYRLAKTYPTVWAIWSLTTEPIDIFEFRVVGREELKPATLHEHEAERLEQLAALKAFNKVMGRGKCRRRKSARTRKCTGKQRRTLGVAEGKHGGDESDDSTGSSTTSSTVDSVIDAWRDAAEGGDENGDGSEPAAPAHPLAAGAGPAAVAAGADVPDAGPDVAAERRPEPRAGRGDRGFKWGPFFISEIWAHGEHSGWGARCGRHHNAGELPGRGTKCKKSVGFGTTGCTSPQLILRLKRWLVEGIDDVGWDIHSMRTKHVGLGGPGMRDFADGLPEEALDGIIAHLT